MAKKPNPGKAARHETKGDELLRKGKPEKALGEFRKALECEPGRTGIFDKLMAAHDQVPEDWDLADFAESVSWAMGKQEQENPPIKQVHAMLSPEWKKATDIAFRILTASADKDPSEMIEELVGMGEVATRALVGILLGLKQDAAGHPNE